MVANFGVLFQLPTLFMGLAKFDLIDVNELKHYRKYIYFGCFVVASIIAPPDITLNLLLTLPLIILFEFSMFIARISQRSYKNLEYLLFPQVSRFHLLSIIIILD